MGIGWDRRSDELDRVDLAFYNYGFGTFERPNRLYEQLMKVLFSRL